MKIYYKTQMIEIIISAKTSKNGPRLANEKNPKNLYQIENAKFMLYTFELNE